MVFLRPWDIPEAAVRLGSFPQVLCPGLDLSGGAEVKSLSEVSVPVWPANCRASEHTPWNESPDSTRAAGTPEMEWDWVELLPEPAEPPVEEWLSCESK